MSERVDLGTATARAGVAGNPSDALGGAAVGCKKEPPPAEPAPEPTTGAEAAPAPPPEPVAAAPEPTPVPEVVQTGPTHE